MANSRVKKLGELLAANGVELLTYRYKTGECSCCYGAIHGTDGTRETGYKGDANWVELDLSCAHNQGIYDSRVMEGSKSYFNRDGKLKADNAVGYGLSAANAAKAVNEFDDAYQRLHLGFLLFDCAQKAGFDVEWEGTPGRRVVLQEDATAPEAPATVLKSEHDAMRRELELAQDFIKGISRNTAKFLETPGA